MTGTGRGATETLRGLTEPALTPTIGTMRDLAGMECVPCRGGVPPLAHEEAQAYLAELGGGWQVVEDHHLEKEYRFKDFREALAFTNVIGELAEEVGHHPDISLAWGRVGVTIWTHKIDGLNEADFVFAAKVDRALQEPQATSG